MARHGKNYRNANTGLEEDVFVEAPAAIRQVLEMAFAKFDETIDVAVRLVSIRGTPIRSCEAQ